MQLRTFVESLLNYSNAAERGYEYADASLPRARCCYPASLEQLACRKFKSTMHFHEHTSQSRRREKKNEIMIHVPAWLLMKGFLPTVTLGTARAPRVPCSARAITIPGLGLGVIVGAVAAAVPEQTRRDTTAVVVEEDEK